MLGWHGRGWRELHRDFGAAEVATVAFAVNVACAMVLVPHRTGDANVRLISELNQDGFALLGIA